MYRYRLIEENEVKDIGITDDPERKERELKRQGKEFSHFKIEGPPITRESAEKWEKKHKCLETSAKTGDNK